MYYADSPPPHPSPKLEKLNTVSFQLLLQPQMELMCNCSSLRIQTVFRLLFGYCRSPLKKVLEDLRCKKRAWLLDYLGQSPIWRGSWYSSTALMFFEPDKVLPQELHRKPTAHKWTLILTLTRQLSLVFLGDFSFHLSIRCAISWFLFILTPKQSVDASAPWKGCCALLLSTHVCPMKVLHLD